LAECGCRSRPHWSSIRRRNSLLIRDFREVGGGFSGNFHARNDLAHLSWRSSNWQSRAWRSELAERAGGVRLAECGWRCAVGGVRLADCGRLTAVGGVGLTGRAFGDVTHRLMRDFREGGSGFSGNFHTSNDLAHLGWRSSNWQSRAWRSRVGGAGWRSELAEWVGGVGWRSGLAEWVGGVGWRSGLAEWVGGVGWRSGLAEWAGGVRLAESASRVEHSETQLSSGE